MFVYFRVRFIYFGFAFAYVGCLGFSRFVLVCFSLRYVLLSMLVHFSVNCAYLCLVFYLF